jgi:hypothetical protein
MASLTEQVLQAAGSHQHGQEERVRGDVLVPENRVERPYLVGVYRPLSLGLAPGQARRAVGKDLSGLINLFDGLVPTALDPGCESIEAAISPAGAFKEGSRAMLNYFLGILNWFHHSDLRKFNALKTASRG